MSETKQRRYKGKQFITKQNELVTIVDIIDNKMYVKFEGFEETLEYIYRTPKDGMVLKNYFSKDVYGVGYLGMKYSKQNVEEDCHRRWRGMLGRCYSDNWDRNERATVCEEWHCFEKFVEWFSKFQNKSRKWHIDKDLEGKMHYSPETVHYIPETMNIAVSYAKDSVRKYQSTQSFTAGKMVVNSYMTLREELDEYKDELEYRTVVKVTELISELKLIACDIIG